MTLFDRTQKLIKDRGITVKQLERDCDLANATIRRWQTQTPNVESVRRVAERLNVSLDYLVTGIAPNRSDEGYSQMENDVITMLRLLNEHDRKNAVDFITMLYEQSTGEKGSLYLAYPKDEKEPGKGDSRQSADGQSGTA